MSVTERARRTEIRVQEAGTPPVNAGRGIDNLRQDVDKPMEAIPRPPQQTPVSAARALLAGAGA